MGDLKDMAYGNIIREIIKKSTEFEINVVGNSMYPAFVEGQAVKVQAPINIQKGDVILYVNYSGNLVLHRIIHISEDYFIAKGDNNEFADDIISRKAIVGKIQNHNSEKYISEQQVYKLTFNYTTRGLTEMESYGDILTNAKIQVKTDDVIDKSENNILIHSSANNKFSQEILEKKKNNIIHFNFKVSNSIREGFRLISDFDHIVYINNPIITGLSNEVQQTFLAIGALNGILGMEGMYD